MMAGLITPSQLEAAGRGMVNLPDSLLRAQIDAASDLVRAYCGWHISPVQESNLILDAQGGHLIRLPSLKVEEVLSLKVGGQPVSTFDLSTRGMIYVPQELPDKFGAIEVRFRHGYESTPGVVQSVLLGVLLNALVSPLGRTQESVGAVSVSYAGIGGQVTLSARDMVLLSLFRLEPRP